MNVTDWPFSEGGFVFMSRPEDAMAGWYFVNRNGKRTFCHPNHSVSLEVLILELSLRLSEDFWEPEVEVVGDEDVA